VLGVALLRLRSPASSRLAAAPFSALGCAIGEAACAWPTLANVSITLGAGAQSGIGITGGQGALILYGAIGGVGGGLAGTFSGNVSAAIGGFDAGISVAIRINTTTSPIDETIVVGGTRIDVRFTSAQVASGSTPYLLLSGSGTIKLGDFVEISGTVSYDSSTHVATGSDLTVFLGQGPFYGLACESGLKLQEMSCSYAQVFHTLEFRHGPKSIAAPQVLVAFLLSETGYDAEVGVLEEIKALGATTLVIANAAGQRARAAADVFIEFAFDVPEFSRLAAYTVPGQMLGLATGLKKGLDPDEPRHLARVVMLQEENGKPQHAAF